MNIGFIYFQLLDQKGENQRIGGVETYILNLAAVCHEMGWKPMLFQCADQPFVKTLDVLEIFGVPSNPKKIKQARKLLYDAASRKLDLRRDILVFFIELFAIQSDNPRFLIIQHGIRWDLPRLSHGKCSDVLRKIVRLRPRTIMDGYTSAKMFGYCLNRVCVDYNYLNWYRSFMREPDGRVWVIPNFTRVATSKELASRDRNDSEVRILFARRFTDYRGVSLMAYAAQEVLTKLSNARITFAGEGPEGEWLRSQFAGNARVSFIRYAPKEAMAVHLAHDIAVVPSLGSEGTSLSVLEAMGAGCAVLATAVGGITNVILSGYNGLMVMPNGPDLAKGLFTLVMDPALRKRLARRGHETAAGAFSLDKWKTAWREVLLQVAGQV